MKQRNTRNQTESNNKLWTIVIVLLSLLAVIQIVLLINKHNNIIKQPQTLAQANYVNEIFTNQEYDITNQIADEPNKPVIAAGMIPIKWNGSNWVITDTDDTSWYNHENGIAYMMLNDNRYQSELQADMSNKELAVKNTVVPSNLLGTIYVWVPRLAYFPLNERQEVFYIKNENTIDGYRTVPSVFTYGKVEWDIAYSLSGVWIEKKPLNSVSEVNTKVNNMTGEDNKYTFIGNTIAVSARESEDEYKALMRRYNIDSPNNVDRTIIKVVNDRAVEPIKAKATFDKENQKINIEVIYTKNGISKIIDEEGNVLSENSTTANTGDRIIYNEEHKFGIIDNEGNQKTLSIMVTEGTALMDIGLSFNYSTQKIELVVNSSKYGVTTIKDSVNNVSLPVATNGEGKVVTDTGDSLIKNQTYTFILTDTKGYVTTKSITVTNAREAIEGSIIFDTSSQMIVITVPYSRYSISSIKYSNGTALTYTTDESGKITANTGSTLIKNQYYSFVVTDVKGNTKTLALTVTGAIDPIQGSAAYNATTKQIVVTVTYARFGVARITDADGTVLSTNSTTANTGDRPINSGTYRFTITDTQGNTKTVSTTVTGVDSGYIYITSGEDLYNFARRVNNGERALNAYQTADINYAAYSTSYWTPIGSNTTSSTTFYGTYNGGGHYISNLKISETNAGFIGGLGYGKLSTSNFQSGTVKNLGIINSTISGSVAGAVVGKFDYGTVTNCWTAGCTVKSSASNAKARWNCWSGV